MKKALLFTLLTFGFLTSYSQGLENIIVEKYYISDANDATVNSLGGVLPVGSVTYRIYIDMLPDYIFQSAYGDPAHELRMETSTLFFNNEDRGAVHPTFNFSYCDDNTVMLDSWLSVGAAANGRFGIQKDQDDGVGTVVNSDGVLTNNDPANFGIPLTQQDGLIAGTPESVITVGIGSEITVFDNQNDGTNGPVFSTFNGAWASVNGSSGPIPAVNQVLLAQITTDGIFSFSLNVQIRNQTTLVVENYVASNPTGSEILFPALNYNSSTGLNDNTSEIGLNVYPNPSKGLVTLEINSSATSKTSGYIVYDLIGKEVMTKKLGEISGIYKESINLNSLPNGFYFVEVNLDGATKTIRVIKN